MPRRNVVRQDEPDSYYHIYGRGLLGREIFKTDGDKMVFLEIIKRYLEKRINTRRNGTKYTNYYGKVDLLAYCVMNKSFHLLFWQKDKRIISDFMKSALVSYTAYYNKKHKTTGPLLESRYRAAKIEDDDYLLSLTRYIHLLPDDYRDYLWSSLAYYVAGAEDDWVKPDKIVKKFDLTFEGYWDMLKDYEQENDKLSQIKNTFADEGMSINESRSEI